MTEVWCIFSRAVAISKQYLTLMNDGRSHVLFSLKSNYSAVINFWGYFTFYFDICLIIRIKLEQVRIILEIIVHQQLVNVAIW